MSANRRLNLNQPNRSAERRRLVPYFLAAILIHLTLLVYALRDEETWKPAPMGAVSLTLGEPVPAHPLMEPPQAVPHPAPAPKQPKRPQKILAIPAKTPSPTVVPTPAAPSAEAAPKTAQPTPISAPSATASAASPSPAVADNPGNPAAPVSAPRFDAAYLLNPKPEYPSLSRRLGEEGRVLLKVRVTAQGLPAAIELEKSSGFERLDEAARRVVARWRFVPAKRGEQPVEASVIVPIAFRLEG